MKCCSKREVTYFKKLSQIDLEGTRAEFYSTANETQQNQLILSFMKQHSRSRNDLILYSVCGQVVCENCFRLVYGIRRNRFKTIKAKFMSGVERIEHGLMSRGCSTYDKIRVISWLRIFFSKVGDKMPASDAIHLPSCLTKQDVYNLAVDELSEGGLYCCSRSTFYSVWTSEFPEVKIPKVRVYLSI